MHSCRSSPIASIDVRNSQAQPRAVLQISNPLERYPHDLAGNAVRSKGVRACQSESERHGISPRGSIALHSRMPVDGRKIRPDDFGKRRNV
jgi:hypothetical protein